MSYFHEPTLDPLIAYDDDFENDPPTVHHPYSAFCQGWDAAEQGLLISLNPYPDDSREARSWEEGHRECLAESALFDE